MKVRRDFVTNSSSSSFIISRDVIAYNELLNILLEIANKEAKRNDTDITYNKKDIKEKCVAGRYNITIATLKNIYTDEYNDKMYDNHYIIDNDCCGRYDWNVIKSVLDEYKIDWIRGYCD